MTKEFQQIQNDYWNKDQSKRRTPFHPCVRALFEPRANYLYNITNHEKASILEIGAGNGYLSVYLEENFNDVLVSDLSEEMLKHNPCKNKLKASATDLPLDDNSFDIVTCSHLLHHLSDCDKIHALNEMRRVSRNKVVVYEPYRNNPFNFLFGLIVKEERESLKFSKTYLKKLFMNTGMRIENTRIEGCILPNKAPNFWIPIGKYLDNTFLRNLGFYIRVTSIV